jgi:hypothetical protein
LIASVCTLRRTWQIFWSQMNLTWNGSEKSNLHYYYIFLNFIHSNIYIWQISIYKCYESRSVLYSHPRKVSTSMFSVGTLRMYKVII